jgi:hypothetical protein
MFIEEPKKRKDDKGVARWRGPLFFDFNSPLMWKDEYYQMLEPPNSVTFPICAFCNHIIWDWPHFEEKVPEHALCTPCGKEEEDAIERENKRWE